MNDSGIFRSVRCNERDKIVAYELSDVSAAAKTGTNQTLDVLVQSQRNENVSHRNPVFITFRWLLNTED